MNRTKRLLIMICIIVLLFSSSIYVYAATTVHINDTLVFLNVGDSGSLKLVNASTKIATAWSSSNSKIVSVSKTGSLSALKEGTAIITAKYNGKNYTSTVKVSNYWTTSSLKTLVNKVLSDKTNWEDGTQLKSLTTFPIKGSSDNIITTGEKVKTNTITVKSISVKKYHYGKEYNGTMQKYKYVVTIKGNLSSTKYQPSIALNYTRKDGAATEPRYYQLSSKSYDPSIKSKMTLDGNNFTYTATQYNVFCDYDEFIVNQPIY